MTTETNTAIAALAPEVRTELLALIQEGLERHEQKKEADKTVFKRVCGSLEMEMKSFDYTVPDEYTDRRGKRVPYNRQVSCWYKIETALSALVRIIYQVEATAKLPGDKEDDIRGFMLDTLIRMKNLQGGQ